MTLMLEANEKFFMSQFSLPILRLSLPKMKGGKALVSFLH